MRALVSGLVLTAVAAPALAQAVDEAQVNRFISAVHAVGCEVRTDAQAHAVEEATGFDEAKLAAIVDLLLTSGRAEIPSSMEGIRVTAGACG